MDWELTKDKTLERWFAIRDGIGTAEPVDLLTDINVLNEMCQKAREEADTPWGYCEYCLFYQQFGGCKEISGQMSECVAARDWEQLRQLVDDFIAHLQAMEVPPPGVHAVGAP